MRAATSERDDVARRPARESPHALGERIVTFQRPLCSWVRKVLRWRSEPGSIPEIAAAVCVQRRDGRPQTLLVRTSDGARWTFPKGRRDPGETLAQTAAREAAEEAGATGAVSETRLIDYRHAPSRHAGRTDDLVAAFLLVVHRVGPSAEPGRDPTWFDLSTAQEKLAEGRDGVHARELRRVLEAAQRAP